MEHKCSHLSTKMFYVLHVKILLNALYLFQTLVHPVLNLSRMFCYFLIGGLILISWKSSFVLEKFLALAVCSSYD